MFPKNGREEQSKGFKIVVRKTTKLFLYSITIYCVQFIFWTNYIWNFIWKLVISVFLTKRERSILISLIKVMIIYLIFLYYKPTNPVFCICISEGFSQIETQINNYCKIRVKKGIIQIYPTELVSKIFRSYYADRLYLLNVHYHGKH